MAEIGVAGTSALRACAVVSGLTLPAASATVICITCRARASTVGEDAVGFITALIVHSHEGSRLGSAANNQVAWCFDEVAVSGPVMVVAGAACPQ